MTLTLSQLPVYVIHGPALVERFERLAPALAEYGVEAQWISDPDATALPPELARRHYRPSRVRWWRRTRVTGPTPFRRLSDAEIAVGISHVDIYSRIAAGESEWALILEDDAVLEREFGQRFDEYFRSLPEDAELVFIGSCCGYRIPNPQPTRHFYRKDHPASKCTDSYLVRRSAAQALLRTIVPFVVTIDWELNYHLKRHDFVVYWLEPPLVSQGSDTGVHASSLR